MWLSTLMIATARVLVGASPRWEGSLPSEAQRIYFANHSSHLDTVALWSALPPELRGKTHPAAAADYWGATPFRRYVALNGLNAVLMVRRGSGKDGNHDPLRPLVEVLDRGESLIIFPEGTRMRQALPDPFKSGLFHLATRYPNAELIPVYLRNTHRSMPRGTFFPVPLICTVHFGAPLSRINNEGKSEFLQRARDAVVALSK